MHYCIEPNSQVMLTGSTKKDALELLKGWITELLMKFVRCLNSANALRYLLN